MYAIIPMGAVALVNLLRERGWSVCGVNAAMERSLSSSFDLARFLASLPRQDLVLIDLHWYMHTAGAFEAASLARALWKDSIIVVGGMTASIFAEDVLRLCPSIDIVISGDAEEAVLQLAELACRGDRDFARIPNAVYWNDNTVCRSPHLAATSPTLFNELDFVTIDWLFNWQAYYKTGISGYSPMQKRRYWLEVARGCFYNCNFPGKFFKNEELIGLLRTLSKSPVELQVFFAANLPWETETTWQETLRLTREIVRVYGCERLTLYAGFITIDPVSPMWINPDKYNIHRYFNSLCDYWRMTNEGVRRPGYESRGLTIEGVRRNLDRFREVAISMRKTQV